MKNIFVFVIGSTPQIITETIYALRTQKRSITPDRIIVFTTTIGYNSIKESLFEKGIFNQFLNDYRIKCDFSPGDVIILRDHKGRELSDIRNSRDNAAIAKRIIETISNLTEDEDTRLICSIAGGRKTMGFYLGLAMNLYGRPQDRLFHVLVSPEFESNKDFFYPPPEPRQINNKLNTKDAKIDLIELPFIRLRNFINRRDLKAEKIIQSLQNYIDNVISNPQMIINLREGTNKGTISILNKRLLLPPGLFAFYMCFLDEKINCKKRIDCNRCSDKDCYKNMGELADIDGIPLRYVNYYKMVGGNIERGSNSIFFRVSSLGDRRDRLNIDMIDEMSNKIREMINKTNKEIQKEFADYSFAEKLKIEAIGRYGDTRYGIPLDKKLMRLYQ